MIHIVFLAQSVYINEIKTHCAASKVIKLALASKDPGEVLTFLNRANHGADVVCIDMCNPDLPPDALETICRTDVPVFVIAPTADAGFKMIHRGANDMIVRRDPDETDSAHFFRVLSNRIAETVTQHKRTISRSARRRRENIIKKFILIGASTGGTEAIKDVLEYMPSDAPPILIVQHMPPVFTRMYAERLDRICQIQVWEARDGDTPSNGLALLAPGGKHMRLEKSPGGLYVSCAEGPLVANQCPSVDVMFNSAAEVLGDNCVGVILTGMGEDGARGLLNLRQRGVYTIGQNEATSVVYGMPKAAYDMGAVAVQLPLRDIGKEIMLNV